MSKISLNGWPVIEWSGDKNLHTFVVPGVPDRRITLHKDAGRILVAIAADYHRWVKALNEGNWDEGGYNYRMANGAPGRFSNHSSGTAVDLNWSKEGAQNTAASNAFWRLAAHRSAVAKIKKIYGEDIVQWGGYWGAKDYMHWEIAPGVSRTELLDKIKFLGIDANGIRHNNWAGKPLPANEVLSV
jgi:hypothetical protein